MMSILLHGFETSVEHVYILMNFTSVYWCYNIHFTSSKYQLIKYIAKRARSSAVLHFKCNLGF